MMLYEVIAPYVLQPVPLQARFSTGACRCAPRITGSEIFAFFYLPQPAAVLRCPEYAKLQMAPPRAPRQLIPYTNR